MTATALQVGQASNAIRLVLPEPMVRIVLLLVAVKMVANVIDLLVNAVVVVVSKVRIVPLNAKTATIVTIASWNATVPVEVVSRKLADVFVRWERQARNAYQTVILVDSVTSVRKNAQIVLETTDHQQHVVERLESA